LVPDAPSFASIAQAIGNPQLEAALVALSQWIETDIHNAEFVPKRSEVRADLKKLKAKTREFEIALNRVSQQRLLELPISADDDLFLARQAIEAISKLCNDTLSSISPKGGVSRKPGRVTCAMIVIEAWTLAKGRSPGASNWTVQEICNNYWLACGGEPIGSDDPGNWRRSIADALSKQSALRRSVRSEIARLCTE